MSIYAEFRSDFDFSSYYRVTENGQTFQVIVTVGLYRGNHRHHPVLEQTEAYKLVGTIRIAHAQPKGPSPAVVAHFELLLGCRLVPAWFRFEGREAIVEYGADWEAPVDCGFEVFCPSYLAKLHGMGLATGLPRPQPKLELLAG